ncbi:hypothetical protein [Nocardioides houyundeii]|uniref:hypothetical protein n=1 Tax=Nocardioides houyundeii TaxID=2045452 RepID=UPI000DF2B0E0|nr:hypothetical protein [Nocardioides houyundeii]
MRVVVVPPVPALLPEHASLTDPVADLRAACLAAVAQLGSTVEVLAEDDLGRRVGEWLLAARDAADGEGPDLLVLANGSARRSEKAPGHLDERAADFDAELGDLLARGDVAGLARLDLDLARELLATGVEGLAALAARGLTVETATVEHDGDPFGVKYWVVRWTCAS